jgi:hypothetical protein
MSGLQPMIARHGPIMAILSSRKAAHSESIKDLA